MAGRLGAEVDGRRVQVEAGGAVLLPMGSTHRWWNAGDETLVFEDVTRPVDDLDVYLAGAFEVLNSGPANRPPIFYMAHLAWRQPGCPTRCAPAPAADAPDPMPERRPRTSVA